MNWRAKLTLFTILVFSIILVVFSSNPVDAGAPGWYNTTFDCYVNVTVTSSAVGDSINVRLTNPSACSVDASYNDIRVVNTTNDLMGYYVDKFNSTTSNVSIWFKGVGDMNYSIYYGNSSAVEDLTDCAATFIACDTGDISFNGTIPSDGDLISTVGGWTRGIGTAADKYSNTQAYSGSLSIENVNLDGSQDQESYVVDMEIMEYYLYDDNNATRQTFLHFRDASDAKYYGVAVWTGTSVSNYTSFAVSGAAAANTMPRSVGWHSVKIYQMANNPVEHWIDGMLVFNDTGSDRNFAGKVFIDESTAAKGEEWYDDIRVYNRTAAIYAEGSEVTQGAPPAPGVSIVIVTLNEPADSGTISNIKTVSMNWTVTSNVSILSCNLWTNDTGWSIKSANTSKVDNNTKETILQTFGSIGTYLWNVNCTDSEAKTNFSVSNYTFIITDTLGPNVNLESPANLSSTADNTPDFSFNYTDLFSPNASCDVFMNLSIGSEGFSVDDTWRSVIPEYGGIQLAWSNYYHLDIINDEISYLILTNVSHPYYTYYVDTFEHNITSDTWTEWDDSAMEAMGWQNCVPVHNPSQPDYIICSNSGQTADTCILYLNNRTMDCTLPDIPNPSEHAEYGFGWHYGSDGYLFCTGAGGINDNSCDLYNITSNSWTNKPDYPNRNDGGRYGNERMCIFEYDGKVWSLGGNHGGLAYMGGLYFTDFPTDGNFTWAKAVSNLGGYPFQASACKVIGNEVHIIGGNCNGNLTGNCTGEGQFDGTDGHYTMLLESPWTITKLATTYPYKIMNPQIIDYTSTSIIIYNGQYVNGIPGGPFYDNSTLVSFSSSGIFVSVGQNNTVFNWTSTLITSNTTLSVGSYDWYTNCTDQSSNEGMSEVRVLNILEGAIDVSIVSPENISYTTNDIDLNWSTTIQPNTALYSINGTNNISLGDRISVNCISVGNCNRMVDGNLSSFASSVALTAYYFFNFTVEDPSDNTNITWNWSTTVSGSGGNIILTLEFYNVTAAGWYSIWSSGLLVGAQGPFLNHTIVNNSVISYDSNNSTRMRIIHQQPLVCCVHGSRIYEITVDNALFVGENITLTTSQGQNNVSVWANDSVGFSDEEFVSFYVDSLVPVLYLDEPENTSYCDIFPQLNFSYEESFPDSCWYSINGTSNITLASCTTNGTNMTTGDGGQNVILYMNDTIGNIASSQVYWTYDNVGPIITINDPENTTYSPIDIPFDFGFDRDVDTVMYSVDDGANVSNSSVNTIWTGNIGGLSHGGHNIAVWANDTCGHSNETIQYFTVAIVQYPVETTYYNQFIFENFTNTLPLGDATACYFILNNLTIQNMTCGVFNESINTNIGENNLTFCWTNSSGDFCNETLFNVSIRCEATELNDSICSGDEFAYVVLCKQVTASTYQFDYGNMTYCESGCSDGECINRTYCKDNCISSDLICNGNYVTFCKLKADGCYDWSTDNQLFCKNGCKDALCRDCVDSCSRGSSLCESTTIRYCDDDNNDGCFEYSQFNTTECEFGCFETLNLTTGIRNVTCNYHSFSDVYAVQQGVSFLGWAFDYSFSTLNTRIWITIIAMVTLGGLAGLKTKSWRIGLIIMASIVGLSTAVGYVPWFISVLFFILVGGVWFNEGRKR